MLLTNFAYGKYSVLISGTIPLKLQLTALRVGMWLRAHLSMSFNWQWEMLALDKLFVQGYMQEKQLFSLWRHANIGRK